MRVSVLSMFLLLFAGQRRAASFSARNLKRAKLEGVRPKAKQSLGQNFLVDTRLARRIAQSVVPCGEDGVRVLELGPGQGAITGHLLERFPRMSAVEIDERMIEVLERDVPALDLRHGDMLQLDLASEAEARGGRLSLVSNTPFYLTSPLLFKLCASVEHVESAILTTQREVAHKVLSPAGCKDYGILAVMLQLFGGPTHLFDLPPEAFSPAPKVHSSVIQLRPSATPPGEEAPLTPTQRAALLGLLKVTFEQRRKMLRVSLKKLLETGAIDPPPDEMLTRRPEQLTPREWMELARACFGDDLGEGVTDEGSRPIHVLERHNINKAWKAHKSGYKD